MDQQGARIGTMSGFDKVHHEAVEKNKMRYESELRKERASSSVIADKIPVEPSEMDEIEDDLDDIDVDFVVPDKKAKKPDVVPLFPKIGASVRRSSGRRSGGRLLAMT